MENKSFAKQVFQSYLHAACLTNEGRDRLTIYAVKCLFYSDQAEESLSELKKMQRNIRAEKLEDLTEEESGVVKNFILSYRNLGVYKKLSSLIDVPERNYNVCPEKENFPGRVLLPLEEFREFYFKNDALGSRTLKERKEIALSDLVCPEDLISRTDVYGNEFLAKVDACLEMGPDEQSTIIHNKYYELFKQSQKS